MTTLNDLTATELVTSANTEAGGLDAKLQKLHADADADDKLLVNAYLGSIRARLSVAEMKLREV